MQALDADTVDDTITSRWFTGWRFVLAVTLVAAIAHLPDVRD